MDIHIDITSNVGTYKNTVVTLSSYRNPELIMIGAFASISKLSLKTIPQSLINVSHTFHYDQLQRMWDRRSNKLSLKGNVKTFCIAEIQYRLYLLTNPSQCHNRTSWKWIDQEAPNPLKNIKLLYFSTKHTSHSKYGPF